MKWIPTNNPPNKDTLCYIACKRADGSKYVPNYPGYYTIGLQSASHLPIYSGFCHQGVIAWLPIPEPYTRNKDRWILISDGYSEDRYPKKRDSYIVSSYDRQGRERVSIAFFEPEKLVFYGHPEVIAWMPIPKIVV